MAQQNSEVITEAKAVINTLRSLIDSRVMCKMEIPGAKQSWITLLLEIRDTGNANSLLIDRVAGFEAVLSKFPDKEVSLEFRDKGMVPCSFNAPIMACNSKGILSELPKIIYRIQRRKYFRMEAFLGTEVTFLAGSSTELKKGIVKNYSAGGVAFFLEQGLNLNDSLTNIHLHVPEDQGLICFHIPKAAVRRIESRPPHGGKALCAIEFIEISEKTRYDIISHVFKKQRVML